MRGTGLSYRNVQKDWRLNERMYGALTGRSKASIALEFGEEQCQAWRRGLHDTPPALTLDHEHWPGRDRRYRRLFKDSSDIPLTESLQDCMDRSIPCLEDEILPQIRSGRDVLVCAHLNTIRGLVKVRHRRRSARRSARSPRPPRHSTWRASATARSWRWRSRTASRWCTSSTRPGA